VPDSALLAFSCLRRGGEKRLFSDFPDFSFFFVKHILFLLLVPSPLEMADRALSPSADFLSVRASSAAPAGGSSSRSDAEHLANALAAQEVVLREQARQNLARNAANRIVASSLEQVRSQLRLSMAACRTAGFPLDDSSGGISYRLLADEFESATMLENPSQADLDAMATRVADSTRQLIALWKTASGSSPPDSGRLRAPPGSASGGPGPAPAPPEASPAPFAGSRAREASPTPSSASAATAMPALKRARVVASDVAAAAAAAAGARLVTIGDNWSQDVKIFVISKVAPKPCSQRGLPRPWRPEHCPPICLEPFQILEMSWPSKAQPVGP
jgi:hypothetical protein